MAPLRCWRAFSSALEKPIFFDMKHSNNAARIRLWMALKDGVKDKIERRVVTYPDLQTPEFMAVNPLKKVPGFIRQDGETVFESHVILSYLEDKYSDLAPSFKPSSPEGRQEMELFMRVHDIYISSPNCTAPGHSHSQGAMYLSKGWHGPVRGIELSARADKLKEIWKQLSWLEENSVGPYLCGEQVTLADFTWFPTCVFFEYMLPKIFGWPDIFNVEAYTPFPNLAQWYTKVKQEPAFAETHRDIWDYWVEMDDAGQFKPIIEELQADTSGLRFVYGQPTSLNYQEPPPQGKRTGRYINQPDKGDLVDETKPADVLMRNGRELSPPATLESIGFALEPCPTAVKDFRDDDEVIRVYYEEIMNLVKKTSGADRVFVFDHTVRQSGNTNLNAAAGESAAPVPRVHCDYTAGGAPRRLMQLGKQGIHSRLKDRDLSDDEIAQLLSGRFAFINVWRSIDDESPVMQKPLAVCDENSVPKDDIFLYELMFPDRTGENYSLKYNQEHKWYYYPKMEKDECLIFKVYDKKVDGPRFVFHTAFDDPLSPADPPPRKSIETRAIAFFDVPWANQAEADDLKADQKCTAYHYDPM